MIEHCSQLQTEILHLDMMEQNVLRTNTMKKILEQRAMILLISVTILAYFLKTVRGNIYGNVFVTVVNMALLWNIASKK